MKGPRIIFAGTPEFALASLSALVEAGHNVVAVYTQPDRPAGRGRKLTQSAVKRYACSQGLPVLQPTTLRSAEAAAELAALKPDLMIVAAYGLLLPQNILDIPRHGCLNVHASLLPRWRGAAPIQAAILAGDEKTGISLMRMTAGLDEGPVFSMRELVIGPEESAAELHDRLATMGGELLVADLAKIIAGDIAAEDQDESLTSYAAKIKTADAELDWSLPAAALHDIVRAYNPAPGAYFFREVDGDSVRIKVWQASVVADVMAVPGSIVTFDANGVVIAASEGGLSLDEVQLPGKRRATSAEFVAQIDLT